ncbi:MAG: PDZ domain-containing protein, partial [Armatimonadota bacterium]|nr:PDZ domain-containing protein [Armatimonadota bacterium]
PDRYLARLGNSSSVRVGQWAVAIGSPFGLSSTFTVGVISAVGRSQFIEDTSYPNLIQTDAAINPGNSGGPLVNGRGQVIGINTLIIATAQGLGFAIPINNAQRVAQHIMEKGSVTYAWLGVAALPVTPGIAAQLGLPTERGVVIQEMVPGSPADEGGLRAGDVLLSADGHEFATPDDLRSFIQKHQPGDRVTFEVMRRGKKISANVVLGAVPEQ